MMVQLKINPSYHTTRILSFHLSNWLHFFHGVGPPLIIQKLDAFFKKNIWAKWSWKTFSYTIKAECACWRPHVHWARLVETSITPSCKDDYIQNKSYSIWRLCCMQEHVVYHRKISLRDTYSAFKSATRPIAWYFFNYNLCKKDEVT